MSSILKALKKLEHEKNGRFPESLKIDSDILRSTDTSSRGFSPFVLTLLFLLVFGGGAAVAYFFIKDTKAPLTTSIPQQAVTAKSLPPQVPLPALNPETLPAEIVVVPASKETAAKMPGNQKLQKPVLSGKISNGAVNKTTNADIPAPSEKPAETESAANREPPPAANSVPALRVNGIAFQTSSSDSVAIVNGTTVSSGSIVEGVTVEEVRKDRVLFQRNGEKFEIQLGQSNR